MMRSGVVAVVARHSSSFVNLRPRGPSEGLRMMRSGVVGGVFF
jgi:hypothetical protein